MTNHTHDLSASRPHSQGTDPRMGPTISGKKRALILGVGGQDGSYLAELLLQKDYEVHGLYRHSSHDNLQRIEYIRDKITLHRGNLLDPSSIREIITSVVPHEIYNEADQDNVGWSEDTPLYNFQVTAGSVASTLEILNETQIYDHVAPKFFQPLSATMFGNPTSGPQTEETPFYPRSPYACAKTYAYFLCKYYRKEFGVDVRTAIFYNHDSPRRTEQYLLPKICYSAVRIAKGLQKELALGNLQQPVDIGFAAEYMEAAWNIMQLPEPDDFIIGSSKTCTIEYLVDTAFLFAGLDPKDKDKFVIKHPVYYKEDFPILHGSVQKAYDAFEYIPKTNTEILVKMIVDKAKEQYT